MNSLDDRTPEAFLPDCADPLCPAQGCEADPSVRPHLSIKCSDSHHMREYGFRLCFLAGSTLKYCVACISCGANPARRRALGTSSRHYASKG